VRYCIKFSKEGNIRYISHLDLLRLFKRSFKRTGIKLQHSQGFNPHPKMSFAQPLSLGYYSIGEYLEFETAETYIDADILDKINAVMPEGIDVLSCEELPSGGKSLAALTESAGYVIIIPVSEGYNGSISEDIADYLGQDRIVVIKHQKKSGKDLEVDIKPMIAEFSGYVDDNSIMLTAKLAAGSSANLSPELLVSSFCEAAGIRYERSDVVIKRCEIYFKEDGDFQ